MTGQTKLSVLDVLDSLIAEYEFMGEVVEARAVVAELIEAAQAAVTDPKGLNRLGVAIARARGIV